MSGGLDSGGSDLLSAFLLALACGLVGVLCGWGNFVVARGLDERRRWAWNAALIIGAVYAPSVCLPFGWVILRVVLSDDAKQQYMSVAR